MDSWPAKATIERIQSWPPGDTEGLLNYVRERWCRAEPAYFEVSAKRLSVNTGGWLLNEGLLFALRKNASLWRSGCTYHFQDGHFEFSHIDVGQQEAVTESR